MISGTYPCCGGSLFLALPDVEPLPQFEKEACPHCGATVWHRLSRFEPATWTEAAFLERFEINEDTKSIVDKQARAEKEALDAMPPGMRELVDQAMTMASKLAAEDWIDSVLSGKPLPSDEENRKRIAEMMGKQP